MVRIFFSLGKGPADEKNVSTKFCKAKVKFYLILH